MIHYAVIGIENPKQKRKKNKKQKNKNSIKETKK